MFTPPPDLPEPLLRNALRDGWSLDATTLAYRPVGFGGHHWVTGGVFVTVADLRTTDYERLRASLRVAQALREAGREFVVAPLSSRDGEPLIALGESFAVAVFPLVAGESFDWDDYTVEHRRAVLDMLVAVHTAPAPVRALARRDDYAIAAREMITAGLDPGQGPYARPAMGLLAAHSADLGRALGRYDALVAAVRADPPAVVLTHGEPHPGNTMRTGDGWVLIDWDTVLLAPPERDLLDVDPGDGSLLAAYTAATGTPVRPELLELYRLRWDLTEIADCLGHFGEPHGATADDDETWANLRETITRVAQGTEAATNS